LKPPARQPARDPSQPRLWRRWKHAVHISDTPTVSVANLSVHLDGRGILTNISFELEEGRQLAVVGPNGAGKTTLLRVLSGLLPTSDGTVSIHGHGPCKHVCIAYVPQKSGIDWRFPVTVYDVVMMGRTQRIGVFRRPGPRDRAVVREALASVNLSDLAQRQISQLSGGQQQRMFLARALAQEADLILLDEPFAGLDLPSRSEVLELISGVRERGIGVVVALHDLGIAATSFDEVLLLKRKLIAHGSAQTVFTEANLREAYGSCLHVAQDASGTFVVHDATCPREEDRVDPRAP